MIVAEAEGLEKSFRGKLAVRGVSVVVHAGEVVAFLGPNGGGKTTTMRMLAGILRPDRGR
ncbi:MAG: ATP-binding cassette domain-containing protein, partial [Zetaproteobacteria bacterium]